MLTAATPVALGNGNIAHIFASGCRFFCARIVNAIWSGTWDRYGRASITETAQKIADVVTPRHRSAVNGGIFAPRPVAAVAVAAHEPLVRFRVRLALDGSWGVLTILRICLAKVKGIHQPSQESYNRPVFYSHFHIRLFPLFCCVY